MPFPETTNMLRQLATGVLVAVGALGLVGTAAATCESGAQGGGYYSVCLAEYTDGGWYYFNTPASVYVAAPGGVASAYAQVSQYSFDFGWGSFGATSAGAGASVAGVPVGASAYQSQFTSGSYSYTENGVCAYVALNTCVGQYTLNGECKFWVIAGAYQSVACGPAPSVPSFPPLPHL